MLEELKKKDDELKELQEFTALEREMEAEQIKQLKEVSLTALNKRKAQTPVYIEIWNV